LIPIQFGGHILNISIFGLGYVGCVSLGCLAKNGHQVIGVDLNDTKVDFINKGKSTVVEKEIDNIIYEQHKLGNISAVNNGIQAVIDTDVSFICVGTPSTSNGHLNLEAIHKVAEEIGDGIREKNSFHVVVIRSTVLPGTNEKVTKIIEDISKKESNKGFAVISNPEFLREGSAVKDYYNPAFTLIGTNNKISVEIMKKIYENINSPFITTDIKIAELIKYVNNAFHALKITFANEIGNICRKIDVNSHELMDVFCMDKKLNISSYYLKPGFAYGGSCLPKDLKALRTIAHDFYIESPVLENIEKSNELQKNIVYEQILNFNKEKVSFLGLSFKAGTDDLRNSPIIDIIERLLGKGFDVKIYDKNVHLSRLVGANKEYILKKIPYISKFLLDNPKEIIKNSDVIIVVNKEKEFTDILNKVPDDKIIYDLVNIDFKKKERKKNYFGIAW
jgi:GDP-mannose 6-dehydrogenase